jgi:hypothetical protein
MPSGASFSFSEIGHTATIGKCNAIMGIDYGISYTGLFGVASCMRARQMTSSHNFGVNG